MKYELILSLEAQNEVTEAVQWYRDRAPLLDKNYHKVLIQRFPYQIIYTVYGETILILAVFHAKRNPEEWKKR